jgi:hypothetical protein
VLERIAQALSPSHTRPSPRPSPLWGEGESRGTFAPEGGEGGARGPHRVRGCR